MLGFGHSECLLCFLESQQNITVAWTTDCVALGRRNKWRAYSISQGAIECLMLRAILGAASAGDVGGKGLSFKGWRRTRSLGRSGGCRKDLNRVLVI